MEFSKLKHRIIFLKQNGTTINGMGEETPKYEPYKPGLNNNMVVSDGKAYLRPDGRGNAVLVYSASGAPMAHELATKEYAVWACVQPMTGREYHESQKIRAETTYKVTTRHFPNITQDMRILFRGRELEIQSVLNVEEKNTELQIICTDTLGNCSRAGGV